MRRATLLLTPIFLLGCASAGGMRNETAGRPAPGANDEVMRDDTPAQHGTIVSVTLDANPEMHIGHEDDELGLHVSLTNESDHAVLLEELAAQLRIDDHDGPQLQLSGHGWTTLQPGETAEWDERNLGVRLFETPGEHTLRLEINEAISPPIDVRVSE